MPIEAYVGKMRQGKGFGEALNAYNHMLRGYPTISNMNFYFTKESRISRKPMNQPLDLDILAAAVETGKPLTQIYNTEKLLVVIDEIDKVMDARKALSNPNVTMSYFASQSAKSMVDIVFATQALWFADNRMRFHTHYIYEAHKILYEPFIWQDYKTGQPVIIKNAIKEFEYDVFDNQGYKPEHIDTLTIDKPLAMWLGERFDTKQYIAPRPQQKKT